MQTEHLYNSHIQCLFIFLIEVFIHSVCMLASRRLIRRLYFYIWCLLLKRLVGKECLNCKNVYACLYQTTTTH